MELKELLGRISYYKRTWTATEDVQKQPRAESTVSAKPMTDSPLQRELGKKWKVEVVSEEDFTKVLSRAQKKNQKHFHLN